MDDFRFNIRVYGIIYDETRTAILVSDEFQLNTHMTKFPGGGLEYGEGPKDCLIREIREETGLEIENIEHYYTTDFFQKALFFENQQLISIYYTCQFSGQTNYPKSNQAHKFAAPINGQEKFRWVDVKLLNISEFTFPIDKIVAEKLRTKQLN